MDLEDDVRGAVQVADRLLAKGELLRIPAAAWVEFLVGVNPGRRAATERALVGSAEFHPFGPGEAAQAVAIHDELRALGRPLNWQDLQVAATARHLREPLLSNDRAFRRVPGLQVIPF